MKKVVFFLISFIILFVALQLVSGLILTAIYIPDMENVWVINTGLANEVVIVKGSILPTLLVAILAAAIAYFVPKAFKKSA
ncbi:hypothetical protein [Bacillus marinisedimentorum]|uniref:hypothetical protein n=1 Tax=Bacillus marinisedimentorum TaxID=1821260 RepID=UPI000872C353|nr:hypothetical protein [Bacillus marinisedimentorum]